MTCEQNQMCYIFHCCNLKHYNLDLNSFFFFIFNDSKILVSEKIQVTVKAAGFDIPYAFVTDICSLTHYFIFWTVRVFIVIIELLSFLKIIF